MSLEKLSGLRVRESENGQGSNITARIEVPINTELAFREKALAFSIRALIPPSLHEAPSATAFSLGISGRTDWLREQKNKSSKFLLAPIEASRNILRAAYLLLCASLFLSLPKGDSDYAVKDVEEVKELLKSAARDCVPRERNSFVAFQANNVGPIDLENKRDSVTMDNQSGD
ncbi:hypothetical protein U1Q18_037020 [Sarracenia purpurea var. burkii]